MLSKRECPAEVFPILTGHQWSHKHGHKFSGVFDGAPGYSRMQSFHFIGKLPDQLADLNNTHTAGVLKQKIHLKRLIAVLISRKIVRNAITIHDNLSEQDLITLLDKATPLLSRCSPGTLCHWIRL